MQIFLYTKILHTTYHTQLAILTSSKVLVLPAPFALSEASVGAIDDSSC